MREKERERERKYDCNNESIIGSYREVGEEKRTIQ
jgi:hypothetical protein